MITELTIFIVDDDPAVRSALSELMESVGYRVEDHADVNSFLDSYTARRPGCLLLDVRMPGRSGLDLHEELIRRRIELPTIIITGHGDISTPVRAMKNEVLDFIEKPSHAQAVLDCVGRALAMETQRLHNEARAAEIGARAARLSPRERQIMELAVSGQSVKELAFQLRLSPETVRIHRSRVLRKMHADTTVALVRLADSLRANRQNAYTNKPKEHPLLPAQRRL